MKKAVTIISLILAILLVSCARTKSIVFEGKQIDKLSNCDNTNLLGHDGKTLSIGGERDYLCYTEFAIANKDPSVCNKLESDIGKYMYCSMGYSMATNESIDESVCDKAPNEEERNQCYEEFKNRIK